MKKIVPVLTLLFIAACLSAQTTVTDITFPVASDTLKTATDLSPEGIEITTAGGPFDWDYSSLNITTNQLTVYRPASEGSVAAEVPIANLVTFNELTSAESYYRVNDEVVELIAVNGNDPIGAGISAIFRFTPPIIERRAPMTFPSNNTSGANLLIAFAWSDLPAIVTDSLPLPIAPDSIRVRVTTERIDFVDAYGTLTIPGGTYEVLREKRTNYSETRVDALLPFFGWQDVTDLLLTGAPFEGLGTDTTITYNFFSNDAKEPIAVATMDNTEENVTSVIFKDNGLLSGDQYVFDTNTRVRVMPNPVADHALFELNGFDTGVYKIGILNMRGQQLYEKQLQVAGDQSEVISLSNFPAGNYFYQLSDTEGKLLATGKLVKL